MEYSEHGGYCCGVFHIYGLNDSPTVMQYLTFGRRVRKTSAEILAETIDHLLSPSNNGRVIEVITASQPEMEEDYDGDDVETGQYYGQTEAWADELVRQGFKAVSSFLNSNSGNRCTIWHRHPDLTLYGDTPQPIAAPVVTPLPEVRPLLVEYAPNFRIGGRRGLFSTVQEVRERYPLIRQIDRRTVFSDGTINWEENV